MADEQLAPAGELEPDAAPAAGEQAPENEAPDPVAALAMELNWKPKDKWEGPEEQWKPADEFIKAGRDISRSMHRELKGLRDQVDRMGRVSSQLLDDKIAERDRYWQGIQAKAVEEGDNALVERAVSERIKLKDQVPAPTGAPPETQDFIARNESWFGKDPLATAHAKQVAQALANEGYPNDVQLREAERAVKKQFPELFPKPKQAPGVNGPTNRTASATSREKGFADMPAASQAMAKEYQQRHGVKLEDFAKSYWADLANNNERKVG